MSRFAPKHRPMRQLARVHTPPVTAEVSKPRYGQGRGGRPWRRKRDAVMKRDAYLCQPCKRAGRVALADEVDHIVPLSRGGDDDDENLQSICEPCHLAKSRQELRRR